MLINLYVLLSRGFILDNDKLSIVKYNDEYIIASEKDNKIYITKYSEGVYSESYFIVNGFNPYLIYSGNFNYFSLTFTWNDKIQRLDFNYGEIGTTSFSPLNIWDGYGVAIDGISRESNVKTSIPAFSIPDDWPDVRPEITNFRPIDIERLQWNAAPFYEIFENIRYRVYEEGVYLGETTNTYFDVLVKSKTIYQVIGIADLKYSYQTGEYDSKTAVVETPILVYDTYGVSIPAHGTKIEDIINNDYSPSSATEFENSLGVSKLSLGSYAADLINSIVAYDFGPSSAVVGYQDSAGDTKEITNQSLGNYINFIHSTRVLLPIESVDYLPTIFT